MVERILSRVLRCSHRHRTSPITLKGESFAVCLDCGSHVAYSLEGLRPGKRVPEKEAVREAPVTPRRQLRSTVRGWTREGIWLGLLAIGFAGGIFYSDKQRPVPENRTTPSPAQPGPKAEQPTIPAALPSVSTTPIPDATPEIHRSNRTPRLENGGRVVVLAREEATAAEVSEHPGKLGELIQGGSLFTVPPGTAIRIVERKRSSARVAVLEGSKAGQEGWVDAAWIRP